jgi:ankyrin repeat protein
VKELAEILAVDFDDAEGIPKLKPAWRWEDQEQALLTSCSSLITAVETDDSRVVQFSHFSVKEYLTSPRLATSSRDVSRYHIVLEPAHTILAQACMSVLLQPEDRAGQNGDGESPPASPLAGYAARHWVTHAQFESVSSFLRKAMEDLYDMDKPYFAAWLQLYDRDTHSDWLPAPPSLSWFSDFGSTRSGVTPLYYAALCGFQGLVEHLVVKYPQHVNTNGGSYVTPLIAALAGRHFKIAEFLHHNGVQADVRGNDGETPLTSAAWYEDLELVRVLLDYKADVNAQGPDGWTPIHYVSQGPRLLPDVAQLLLEHGADIHARTDGGSTPLHVAAECGRAEVIRVLLEHGADVGVKDNGGRTPLYVAESLRRSEVIRVLLEHGADVAAEDNEGRTPFPTGTALGAARLCERVITKSAKSSQGKYKAL